MHKTDLERCGGKKSRWDEMQHSAQQCWLLTFFWGQNILIARAVRILNYIEKNKAVKGVCSTDMNDEEQ